MRTVSPRRTAGKTSLGRIVFGSEALASVLADALGASEDVDRATHGFHT